MQEIYYTYNNEAIASCVFISVLQQEKRIDIARAFLLLPFLLDDRIVHHLQVNGKTDLGIFILAKPQLFSAFNRRYLNLMPIAINSLMLLNKSKHVNIGKEIISTSELSFDELDLGERFYRIESVMSQFLVMLKDYSTTQLYQILNIQL